MRCVEVELGTRRKRCVTHGNQHVAEVLRAAGITELDPPAPPGGLAKPPVVTKLKNRPRVCLGLQ
jgi:hypothetical protein